MRVPSWCLVLPLSACALASGPDDAAGFASVRDRLQHEPARLLVLGANSSGTVTARHYSHDGWQDGMAAIAPASGELETRADGAGQLALATFTLDLAPIDIPQSVFGTAAQLTN